jgi:hypothetical protein
MTDWDLTDLKWAATGASGLHADAGQHRGAMIHHLGRRIMLGVPLGAGSAHVVQLGSVGVEQGVGETVNEVSKVDRQTWRLAAGGEHPNCL